jgi:hypothetical protein
MIWYATEKREVEWFVETATLETTRKDISVEIRKGSKWVCSTSE